jgi:hypothetical protein
MIDDQDPDGPLVTELRTLFARVDPVPPLVTQAGKAALGWRRLDADLAELLSDSALEEQALARARGAGAPVRSVLFSAGELTIDIEIHPDDDRRRLLGQLSPPTTASIEIQSADAAVAATASSDSMGRFRAQLPGGGAIRLRVVPGDTTSWASGIETSWITI